MEHSAVLSTDYGQSRESMPEATSGGSSSLSPVMKDFLAGGLAGALAISSTQPLDTVRIRQQQQRPSPTGATAGPKGVVGMLRQMMVREGMFSPWKGMALPLAFASFQNAMLFQVYGLVLRYQQSNTTCAASSATSSSDGHQTRPVPTAMQGFLAGCVAGFGQVCVWSPIELLKLKLQLQSSPKGSPGYLGAVDLTKHVWKTEGLRGFYRAVSVTTLRDVPSFGVYFGVYHALVAALEGPDTHSEDASPTTHMLAGGSAGCIAWMSVYGLDVIKTRMQATPRAESLGLSWVHFAKQVWHEDGARGFLKGIKPTLARAFMMDTITFLGFAYSMKALS